MLKAESSVSVKKPSRTLSFVVEALRSMCAIGEAKSRCGTGYTSQLPSRKSSSEKLERDTVASSSWAVARPIAKMSTTTAMVDLAPSTTDRVRQADGVIGEAFPQLVDLSIGGSRKK